MVVLWFVGLIMVWVSVWIMPDLKEKKLKRRVVIGWFVAVLGCMLLSFYVGYEAEKEANIDALNGKFKYEQQIEYTYNSSGDCVEQDTIYVKIKKWK